MPTEIEAKFRVLTHDEVRARLIACGATRDGLVTETNVILDRADGSLRGAGCGLRVRSTRREDGSTGTTTLTFKGPRQAGPLKKRDEWEVSVSDAEAVERIMTGCGFVPVLSFEKRRESWHLDGCRVELDEPARLGRFVEVEGPGEDVIRSVQERIGLSDAQYVPDSYVQLLVAYCQAQGIADRRLSL